MPAPRVAQLLRSLLAIITAVAVLVAGIWLSGEIAAWLGLSTGGETRLAWDLGGTVVPALLAFMVAARLAPGAPRRHVLALLLPLMAVLGWSVWTMGADYPLWFSAGLLVMLPLAACWVALRSRGGRHAGM